LLPLLQTKKIGDGFTNGSYWSKNKKASRA
jgi:hypothetical protein